MINRLKACKKETRNNMKGYIDPSAISYLLQIIVGIVVALGTAAGVYWHRIKRFLKTHKKNRNE